MSMLSMGSEPSSDRGPAEWLIDRLAFGGRLGSWMPDDFERYARVLHPAREYSPGEEPPRPIRWKHVARWSGKELRSDSTFHEIQRRPDGSSWSERGYGKGPWRGFLFPSELDRLVEHLADATLTPERLWLLKWDGFGAMRHQLSEAFDLSKSLTDS